MQLSAKLTSSKKQSNTTELPPLTVPHFLSLFSFLDTLPHSFLVYICANFSIHYLSLFSFDLLIASSRTHINTYTCTHISLLSTLIASIFLILDPEKIAILTLHTVIGQVISGVRKERKRGGERLNREGESEVVEGRSEGCSR